MLLLLSAGCSSLKQPDIPTPGSFAWMQRIDQIAGLRASHGKEAEVGSPQWMQIVSERFGVYDRLRHNPSPGSSEWVEAIDRKIFRCPGDIKVRTYTLAAGEELTLFFDEIRNRVTFTYSGRDISLPRSTSVSGMKFGVDGMKVLWVEEAAVTYWEAGTKIFEGIEKNQ